MENFLQSIQILSSKDEIHLMLLSVVASSPLHLLQQVVIYSKIYCTTHPLNKFWCLVKPDFSRENKFSEKHKLETVRLKKKCS